MDLLLFIVTQNFRSTLNNSIEVFGETRKEKTTLFSKINIKLLCCTQNVGNMS